MICCEAFTSVSPHYNGWLLCAHLPQWPPTSWSAKGCLGSYKTKKLDLYHARKCVICYIQWNNLKDYRYNSQKFKIQSFSLTFQVMSSTKNKSFLAWSVPLTSLLNAVVNTLLNRKFYILWLRQFCKSKHFLSSSSFKKINFQRDTRNGIFQQIKKRANAGVWLYPVWCW